MTITEIYQSLPERQLPKKEFIKRIARVTMRSELTVRNWIGGRQIPDPLVQKTIADELGVSVEGLFNNEIKEIPCSGL